jgi:hypothetical protein
VNKQRRLDDVILKVHNECGLSALARFHKEIEEGDEVSGEEAA